VATSIGYDWSVIINRGHKLLCRTPNGDAKPHSGAQLHLLLWPTVWVKKIPPEIFWHFFQNGWEFLVQITQAYYTFTYTLVYKFLLNYLQLWQSYAILSTTTIICSKCSPSTETHAGRSHLIWHNFVKVGENWIKICILAYIWTLNSQIQFELKIPKLFGENVRKCQRAFRLMMNILRTWFELGGHA